MLHAYLIVVFGDIPAVSMIMRMKGHNAISLNRDNFPGVNPGYEADSLPLQNHDTFLKQATEVQTASTTTASNRLATKYGIKGLPLLTALTSLSFLSQFHASYLV